MFKDMVAADIDQVILNEEEFADWHDLNGKKCLCVVSDDATRKRSTLSSRNYSGLHGEFTCLAVKKDSLPREPKQGENFKFDGKLYKVISCVDDMGMYTIELGAYRMGMT